VTELIGEEDEALLSEEEGLEAVIEEIVIAIATGPALRLVSAG
jgi:hypothetical protein